MSTFRWFVCSVNVHPRVAVCRMNELSECIRQQTHVNVFPLPQLVKWGEVGGCFGVTREAGREEVEQWGVE